MYKCDCCILSLTSANTDNDHCDDVLMSMMMGMIPVWYLTHAQCITGPGPLMTDTRLMMSPSLTTTAVVVPHHYWCPSYITRAHIYTMHPLFSQNIHVINIVGKHFAFSVFSQDLSSCIIYLNYAGFLFINTKAHIYFYNFAARFNIKNLNFNLITL